MKFGKLLDDTALPKFRGYYIQYKDLKKALKVWTGHERDSSTVQEVTHWASSFLRLGPNPEVLPEMRLQQALRHELERISKFAGLEAGAIASQLDRLEEDAAKPDASPGALSARLDEVGDNLVQLKVFAQVNFTGFRKILKKYDKWSASKTSVTPWFMAEVVRAPFMNIDYEGLLAQMCCIATAIRPKAGSEELVMTRRSTGTFDITVQGGREMVFLIDPKDIIKVKVMLAKHLLRRGPTPAKTAEAAAGKERPQRARTTSLFLDTADLAVYRAHMAGARNEEAAEAVRMPPCASAHFRYVDSDAVCLVHEGPRGKQVRTEVLLNRTEALKLLGGAAAQPVSLPADAAARVAGPGKPSLPGAQAGALAAVQAAVKDQGQRPIVQASYVRSTFQDEASCFSIVLDEDVRMARVSEPFAASTLGSEHFPRSILSITCTSTTQVTEVPKWFRFINDSFVQVPGFSKAAYGLAHFRARESAKETGLQLPLWYNNILSNMSGEPASNDASEVGSSKSGTGAAEQAFAPAAAALPQQPFAARVVSSASAAARLLHDFGTTPEDEARHAELSPVAEPAADGGGLGAPLLAGSGRGGGPKRASGGGPLRRLARRLGFVGARQEVTEGEKPTRDAIVAVQPKTLFSNERTFLEWMHFATITASFGVVMMHTMSAPGPVNVGRGLVLFAICLVIWSLHTFNWRADALDTKESRDYSDPVGPPVLMGCLLIALAFSTGHALMGASQ